MSITYTPTTNFAGKDGLPANDSNKVVKGAEFTTEFSAIQSAFALAAPSSNPTVTGTATFDDVSVGGDLSVTGAFTSLGIDDNATSTAITIDSSEHVGIGQTSPAHILDISDANPIVNMEHAAGNSSRIYFQDATDGGWGGIKANYGASGAEKEISIAPGSGTGDARFGGLSVKPAVVKVGGDFQQTRLEVNDKVKVEGIYPALELLDTDSTLGLGTRMVTTSDKFLINTLSSAGTYVEDIYSVTMNASGPTQHSWSTEAKGTAMSLTNGGNLGIGTSSPGQALHVQANTTNGFSGSGLVRVENTQSTTASIAFYTTGNDYSIGSNASNRFNVYDVTNASTPFIIEPNCPTGTIYASSGGNVGIGETAPEAELHISAASPDLILEDSDTSSAIGSSNRVRFRNSTGTYSGQIGNDPAIDGGQNFTLGTLINYPVGIMTNGSTKLLVDSSGNVGIGGTPTSALHVFGDAVLEEPSPTLTLSDTSDGSTHLLQSINTALNVQGAGQVRFTTAATERMRIDSAGNVGIGTDTPSVASGGGVVVYDSAVPRVQLRNSTTGDASADGASLFMSGNDLGIENREGSNIIFYNADEKMRIDSSGNLLVGRTASGGGADDGHTLYGTGAIYSSLGGTASTNQYRFYRNGSIVGSINTSGTGTSYVETSDERVKENIVDAPAGNIDDIKVRSFDFKNGSGHVTYGFIAQELHEVAPQAVAVGETDEDMWGVDYSKLVPMLVKEIQDLKAEVEALKNA